jgi:hypothetical protein
MSTLYVNNIEPVSGSSLTLISASLVSVDNLSVASLTSSFQGNLQGTASFATTASFALNSTQPGGTEGQIQFNSGSIFGADSNLFWDNVNKRLGIGTTSPSRPLSVSGIGRINDVVIGLSSPTALSNTSNYFVDIKNTGVGIGVGLVFNTSAMLHVRGSGATSATTALLVQNSAGTELVKVLDNGSSTFQFTARFNGNGSGQGTILEIGSSGIFTSDAGFVRQKSQGQLDMINTTNNFVGINQTSVIASAMFAISSTNRGFLPPRMTTTQKNAIATPSAGLEVYDATVSGSYFHDGSSWRNVIAGDDTNLVWDNTNKRLGVGFNNPSASLHVRGSSTGSATTALLVQNSAGTAVLTVKDGGADKVVVMPSALIGSLEIVGTTIGAGGGASISFPNNRIFLGNGSVETSARLQVDSTTQGFLPPRMTTTQKNAITSPAAGLQVYDTTLNQMSYYNGTSWVNF